MWLQDAAMTGYTDGGTKTYSPADVTIIHSQVHTTTSTACADEVAFVIGLITLRRSAEMTTRADAGCSRPAYAPKRVFALRPTLQMFPIDRVVLTVHQQ